MAFIYRDGWDQKISSEDRKRFEQTVYFVPGETATLKPQELLPPDLNAGHGDMMQKFGDGVFTVMDVIVQGGTGTVFLTFEELPGEYHVGHFSSPIRTEYAYGAIIMGSDGNHYLVHYACDDEGNDVPDESRLPSLLDLSLGRAAIWHMGVNKASERPNEVGDYRLQDLPNGRKQIVSCSWSCEMDLRSIAAATDLIERKVIRTAFSPA